jgi:hypothetical protein
VTLPNALSTNWVPLELPPQSTPVSFTVVPVIWKTSDPLSPPATPAETKVWQSWAKRVPETPVLTQVLVIAPAVHPVVRPTLLTVVPTRRHPPRVAQSSALMVNVPVISRLPLFGALVRAIWPSAWLFPSMYAARAASLKRQSLPLGHPVIFLW